MDDEVLTRSPILCVTPDDGRQAPLLPGEVSARLFSEGAIEVRWYAPKEPSEHGAHDRDELYFVSSGNAVFVRAEDTTPFGDEPALPMRGTERVAVQPGDVLYVPAGTEHRFEAMSPDFGTWAVFTGPEGGGPC